MSAKDFYHDTVRDALDKDGWTITHDLLEFRMGVIVRIDLAAEQLLTARPMIITFCLKQGGGAKSVIMAV